MIFNIANHKPARNCRYSRVRSQWQKKHTAAAAALPLFEELHGYHLDQLAPFRSRALPHHAAAQTACA